MTGQRSRLEHFQEKWNPVFRPKMRQCKNARAVSVSVQTALGEGCPLRMVRRLSAFGAGVAQSAAAKCAIWSACAFTKDGRAVARATYSRQAGCGLSPSTR